MPRRPSLPAPSPRSLSRAGAKRVAGAGLLLTAALGITVSMAQTARTTEPAARTEPSKAASSAAATTPSTKPAPLTKPLWSELTAEQQQALQPLAPHWNTLQVAQKRKWLALSRNYGSLPAEDQTILRSRMIEWAALSNQQRAQARLTFAEVKRVPADERKAKWERYQSLSDDEKRKLAESAPPKTKGAAIPVRPVSSQKLVAVPTVTPPGQHTPRIQLAPPSTVASPASLPSSGTVPIAPLAGGAPGAPAGINAPASARLSNPTPQPVPAEAQVPSPYASSSSPTTSVSSTPSSTSAGRAAEQPSSAP